MSILDHYSARRARTAGTPSALTAALAMMTVALSSHAADGRPIFHVEHVRPIEGAPSSLAFDLQLTRARGTRPSVLVPSDSQSFRVQLVASGRCLQSGPMRITSVPTGRKQSLICLLQLADCDSVPHDGIVLVEAVDGRVLARSRWHFRTQGPPPDRTSNMSVPSAMPAPNRAVPMSDMEAQARAAIPTVRVSWGLLKLLYRDQDRP